MSQSRGLLYRAEDEIYSYLLSKYQEDYLKRVAIPEWLENAESPFKWLKSLKWNLHIVVHNILTEKLLDYKNQGPDYGFEKFALLLTLSCMDIFQKEDCDDGTEDEESGLEKNTEPIDPVCTDGTEDAESSLESDIKLMALDCKDGTEDEESYSENNIKPIDPVCKDKTKDAESGSKNDTEPIDPEKSYAHLESVVEEMRGREGDVMYTRIGPAFEHVLTATRANMLHLMGRDEESKQMSKNLVPVENMSLESKAGFEGIRSKFIVHMYQDMSVALEAMKKSIELDPDFGYWKYMAAKIMRRHRRFLKLEMEPEELEYFEQAVALERNPKFLVFLAQANQEAAMLALSGNAGFCSEEPRLMFERAVQLFRECWKLKNDSAAIARRIGNGMMKMRHELFDFELAKEALHKAVELSPNPVTYHGLGKLYLYHAHDEEKALKYFNSIKGMFGTGELIRYKLINDPESDISEHIEYWKEIAPPQVKRDMYYCDIGWYYLCVKPNIMQATHFFWLVLKEDSHCFRVLNFQSYPFAVKGPLNMLVILVNQILLALEKYSQIHGTEKQCALLNDFLEKVYEKHPNLRQITPDRELLPNIRRQVLKGLAILKRRMYGRTNSEGDGRNNRGNSKMERRTNTVENWRAQNKTEDSSRDSSCQSGRNRNQLSSGEYGETSGDMKSFGRRRKDSEKEEQNQNSGRNQRWNERYDSYNQRNAGNNGRERHAGSETQHGQWRGKQGEQRQNSRYDTTVTNWRAEKKS